MIKRIGFACKWIDHPEQINGIKPKDDCKKYNTGSTTVAWLNRQTKDKAVEKLWTLMKDNIEATRKLVERVGNLDAHLRMVRLSSDILPVYTEPTWSWFGGSLMSLITLKSTLSRLASVLATLMFACLFILASSQFWLQLTQALLTEA